MADVQLIHLVTGIPMPCIVSKVNALVAIGFLERRGDGYVVSHDCATLIENTVDAQVDATNPASLD
jgi:hypothetical protein